MGGGLSPRQADIHVKIIHAAHVSDGTILVEYDGFRSCGGVAVCNQRVLRIAQPWAWVSILLQMSANDFGWLARINVNQVELYTALMIGFVKPANRRGAPIRNRAISARKQNHGNCVLITLPEIQRLAIKIKQSK